MYIKSDKKSIVPSPTSCYTNSLRFMGGQVGLKTNFSMFYP